MGKKTETFWSFCSATVLLEYCALFVQKRLSFVSICFYNVSPCILAMCVSRTSAAAVPPRTHSPPRLPLPPVPRGCHQQLHRRLRLPLDSVPGNSIRFLGTNSAAKQNPGRRLFFNLSTVSTKTWYLLTVLDPSKLCFDVHVEKYCPELLWHSVIYLLDNMITTQRSYITGSLFS